MLGAYQADKWSSFKEHGKQIAS